MLTIYVWYSVIYAVFAFLVLLWAHKGKPIDGEAAIGFIVVCLPVLNVLIPVLYLYGVMKNKGFKRK